MAGKASSNDCGVVGLCLDFSLDFFLEILSVVGNSARVRAVAAETDRSFRLWMSPA